MNNVAHLNFVFVTDSYSAAISDNRLEVTMMLGPAKYGEYSQECPSLRFLTLINDDVFVVENALDQVFAESSGKPALINGQIRK